VIEISRDKEALFRTIGATNHSDNIREINDYYATEPKAVEVLLDETDEKFSTHIWEPACGEGHIAKVLQSRGYDVRCTDLVYRGFGETDSLDFLALDSKENFDGDIITNPPYSIAKEFVNKGLDVVSEGHKVVMLLKLVFLESKSRRELFNVNPPKKIFVFSKRVTCAKNGDFKSYSNGALAYAWYVWQKGWFGDTVVKWVN
jgi:hypothetical protein